MRRYSLRVAAADAEVTVARMLDWFPDGVVEERDGDDVVISGYAESPPAEGLAEVEVADGWEDAWREFHRPVRQGRIWVAPPWCAADAPASCLPVIIDPGRAFGTGGHGSTRAALELLQQLPPCEALDLGCGSGVLSIAAVLLGFGPLRAFDHDPLAVSATAENARRNGVAVEVALRDVLTEPLPTAPLWLANLELYLLSPLLARADLPPVVLVSGLLADQTVDGVERAEVDGWAAELVRR
jgi:ribosomal protein L11 methyltransferase